MSKRRATEDLYGSTDKAQRQGPNQADRVAEFTAHLRALNSQFAQWVQQQAAQHGDQLWSYGVKDYVRHADKLLEEFDDVVRNGQQRQSSPPLASNLFGTPAPAAAAANGSDAALSAGGAAGGRKSVTFAPTPSFSAAGPAGVAATPNPNTANAGHTPAPVSGLGFKFGATPGATPGSGGELPSPEPFKLGASATPSTAGAAAGAAATPGTGFTFGNGPASTSGTPAGGFGLTPAAAAGDSSAAQAAAKGFMFGVSASSTPSVQDAAAGSASSSAAFWGVAAGSSGSGSAAAAASTPAAAASSGASGGFSFGVNPGSTPAAASGSSPSTFSFGALPPSSSGAAGSSGTTPAFSFATTPAAGASASGAAAGGGLFKFPAPAAAAAGASDAAAAAGGDEAGEDEGPPKFKPEIKVDESVWRVFFSSKARLHVRVKKEGGVTDWEPRGLGMLTVRQPKEGTGSDKTYIMFSTDVGKQLVSSQLMGNSAVMPFPNNPKKCRMSLMVLQYDLPPAGQGAADGAAAGSQPKHTLQVCMISLSTPEKVEELSKVVDEHKPK